MSDNHVDILLLLVSQSRSALKGITAKNYDVYAIEGNYDEEVMNEKLKEEGYQHGYRSIRTHLSILEREQFIKDNAGKEYLDLKLHQSSTYL